MSWGKLVTPVEPLGFALTSDQLTWISILSWNPCTAVFSLTVSEDRAQSWSLHTLLDCHYASFLPVSGILAHMSKLPWDILEQITAGGLSSPQWETFLSCLNIWGDYTNNNKSVINECLKDIKDFFNDLQNLLLSSRILCFYADRIGYLFSWVWLSVVSPEKRTQRVSGVEIIY